MLPIFEHAHDALEDTPIACGGTDNRCIYQHGQTRKLATCREDDLLAKKDSLEQRELFF